MSSALFVHCNYGRRPLLRVIGRNGRLCRGEARFHRSNQRRLCVYECLHRSETVCEARRRAPAVVKDEVGVER